MDNVLNINYGGSTYAIYTLDQANQIVKAAHRANSGSRLSNHAAHKAVYVPIKGVTEGQSERPVVQLTKIYADSPLGMAYPELTRMWTITA